MCHEWGPNSEGERVSGSPERVLSRLAVELLNASKFKYSLFLRGARAAGRKFEFRYLGV